MRKVIAPLWVMLAVAACAKSPPVTTPASPDAPPAISTATATPPGRISIRIPQRVAAFTLLSRNDYEDKALGVQLRYRGPDSMLVDVFVYPGPDLAAKCPRACATEVMAAEVRGFEEGIPEMVKRGLVQSASVAATEALVPPTGAPWHLGHHTTLATTRGGQSQRSDFRLYYLPGYRVKLRSTYVESGARPADLRAFTEALIPALVGGTPPPT